MNRKILLSILWITSVITFAVVLGAYIYKLGSTETSNDPAVWGQFGDYLGGTLNPILALLNLIVLTYLTIKISDIDDHRNRFTLQELARPLADMKTIRESNSFEILLKNCGLGPLRIKKVSIIFQGNEYNSFKKVFSAIPNTGGPILWSYWYIIDGDESIIAKDQEESLVKLSSKDGDGSNIKYFEQVYEALNNIKLTIEYNDIYDRPMPPTVVDYSKAEKFQPQNYS